MNRLAAATLLSALLVLTGQRAEATTWGKVEVECPLCSTKTSFYRPMSSGSYIYRWPSRLQMVFWPSISERSIYSCTSCRLTCFMWDFNAKIPEDKKAALRKTLGALELAKASGELAYLKIPVLERLAAAEKTYQVLGRSPSAWSQFYRTWGYHVAEQLTKSKDPKAKEKAAVPRRKAIEWAKKLLSDPKLEAKQKETRIILGAMYRAVGDLAKARKELELARDLEYGDPPEKFAGANEYLDGLIDDLLKLVEKAEKPPAKKTQ